ncbi:DUF6993 domain-containing protein [Microbacterium hydrocarbonoxydans]|uniref:DUF6993 domain-containing protein n=1 Tax=Microbacterium hydrocarbonoxydans TaxID=273678 RepID=UPI0027E29716|nr:hypothetical protein [Microbacterium hydrocarbonoxydans]
MLRRQAFRTARAAALLSVAFGATLMLSACGPQSEPTPSPSATETSAEPTPSGPVLVPEGTAEENLPLFSAVTAQVWASDQRVAGRAYIDALIAAGFDREAMQVTEDVSTVGNPAESLQFSVRWGETECLVGQVGPSTGEPVTAVLPQLAEGRCLIGSTRPIDW